jgi:hypothetical protein
MQPITAIEANYRRLFHERCDADGVQSIAFWRLDLLGQTTHDREQLRRLLYESLISNAGMSRFSSSWVPAFLLFVQTHAAGHSHHLWKETVIPLLAGEGAGKEQRVANLKQAFEGEQPFRSAFRSWLKEFARDRIYLKSGTHFWFVRATIGECALAWVSGEFSEEYLKSLFRETGRMDDLESLARRRFTECLARHAAGFDADRRDSLAAMEDCLVEAGVQLILLARLLREQVPPAAGWTLESVYDRASQLGLIRAVGLPPVVRKAVEHRLQLGMQEITANQLLALARRFPSLQLGTAGSAWTFSSGKPPPIACTTLSVGDGYLRQVRLVDDMGRGPEELLEIHDFQREKWQLDGDLAWRMAGKPFTRNHPQRLKIPARPVIPPRDDLSHVVAWVWTGPADSFENDGSPEVPCVSGSSFRLVAWPCLRENHAPHFHVSRLFVGAGENERVDLVAINSNNEELVIYSGIPQTRLVNVFKTLPADPIAPLTIRFTRRRGQTILAERTTELNFPCPYLAAGTMRKRPGRHVIEQHTPIVLICRNIPSVVGGIATCLNPGDDAGKVRTYSIASNAADLRVAADGSVWQIRLAQPLEVRIHLAQRGSNEGPSAHDYEFENRDIFPFFARPPRLIIEVPSGVDGKSQRSREEILDLLDSRLLLAGLADESVPDYTLAFKTLVQNAEWTSNGSQVHIEADLTEHFPDAFTNPSLQIRRLALDDWNEDQAEGSISRITFVVLPWNRERLIPRTPSRPGGVVLEDSTGAFSSLCLTDASFQPKPQLCVGVSGSAPRELVQLLRRAADTAAGIGGRAREERVGQAPRAARVDDHFSTSRARFACRTAERGETQGPPGSIR